MLINGSKLSNCPVLSLHVGGEIARTVSPVVDPNDLKIIAYTLNGPIVGKDAGNILEAKDIRELSHIGMIVDSSDEFVSSGDVIHLDEVMNLNFSLIGLKVVTKKGTKLGKVSDYTVNTDNFMVQQLVVQRPALKSFLDPELIIGRNEIVEIDDYKITVKDEESKIRERSSKEDFVPNFVNPFRRSELAHEKADTKIPDAPNS